MDEASGKSNVSREYDRNHARLYQEQLAPPHDRSRPGHSRRNAPHWEDLAPAVPGYQAREGGEPESIGWLVADRTRYLPAQHRVLMPQHKKFSGLRCIAPEQRRRQGEQPAGHHVQQGHDHANMLPADGPSPLLPATMTFRAAQDSVARFCGSR
jgi:hypothetical protein